MRRRLDPARMAMLAAVQDARRMAADAALREAHAAEAAARADERTAQDQLEQADTQWRAFLAQPGFAPEYAGGLAHLVVARGARMEAAAHRHRTAIDAHAARQDDWRTAEARMRSAERDLSEARRAAARRRDDDRQDAVADRVTYAWTRR